MQTFKDQAKIKFALLMMLLCTTINHDCLWFLAECSYSSKKSISMCKVYGFQRNFVNTEAKSSLSLDHNQLNQKIWVLQ